MPLTDETALCGMTTNDGSQAIRALALAHEIKNPAALALAHVQLLRNGIDKKGFDHIERALNTIVDLAQEMLSVTYGQPLAFDFDLYEVLGEVLGMYQAAWPGVRFLLTPHAPLTIRAHEVSVRMVFSNLIKNAVEAVSGGGHPYPEVTLSAATEGDYACVTICDNGPGYSETHGCSKKPQGNGLGLPIARWLLDRMGGRLELQPNMMGGCKAVVRLLTA
ncbi:MAG: HAMP domain-containing histidine kinase [Defluviitaleaceae bacterium]|nr:HAMP domain-containing histidine kinase [Defluviitaleaceae bacterium]